MAALRKDQDATDDLVDAWTGMQQLQQQLAMHCRDRTRRRLLTSLQAKLSPRGLGGARADGGERRRRTRADGEGRPRAKQLADAALTLAPDSPDAHEAMGDR